MPRAAKIVAVVGSLGWRRLLGLGLAVCLAGYGCAAWRESRLESALLRTPPELIANDPRLTRFAAEVAKPVYRAHCASCHGADLEGSSYLGAANLSDGDWLYGTGEISDIERTIYYGIRSGHPKSRHLADMPAFGQAPPPDARYKIETLTPDEIRDLVAYLFRLEGRPSESDAADRGEILFTHKGDCFDCHSPHGHGDPGIGAPNLSDSIWLYGDGSPDSVFRTIEAGRKGVCPAWAGQLPAVGIRALAVYIYLKSHADTAGAR